jgi:hypothetical protein
MDWQAKNDGSLDSSQFSTPRRVSCTRRAIRFHRADDVEERRHMRSAAIVEAYET